MARIIYCDKTGPYEIKPSNPDEKSIWVCGCGLSQNLPFCDKSHATARQEQEGKLYVYNKDRTEAETIKDGLPDKVSDVVS